MCTVYIVRKIKVLIAIRSARIAVSLTHLRLPEKMSHYASRIKPISPDLRIILSSSQPRPTGCTQTRNLTRPHSAFFCRKTNLDNKRLVHWGLKND
jgi:hypothetical protein